MILNANALSIPLATGTIQTCVTSPPYYGLRDYGIDGQLGLEQTPQEYIDNMVAVFREVWRVMRDDGTLWLNLGDSYCNTNGYARAQPEFQRKGRNDAPANDRNLEALHAAGYKTKDLIGIPWRVALALQADGWYLRSDIIWHKPNPMPESVTDRPTKAHEYIFLMTKSARYYYDAEAVKEEGTGRPKFDNNAGSAVIDESRHDSGRHNSEPAINRNRRSVWTVATQPYPGAHFATFPPKLIEPCILAGSRRGDIVLDPFSGSGTTGRVAVQHGRQYVGLELNPEYIKLAPDRMTVQVVMI